MAMPFPSYAASYGDIKIDGYYDDWADKPHTDVYKGSKPPEWKIHKVALFRDEKNLYVHIKFADINNQAINNLKINIHTAEGNETYELVPNYWADDSFGTQTIQEDSWLSDFFKGMKLQEAAPQDTTTDNMTPQDTTTDNTAPQDTTTDNAAPQDTPTDNTAPQDTPTDNTAPQDTPTDNAAPQDTPTDNAAPQDTPTDNAAPQDTTNNNAAPQDTTTDSNAPQKSSGESVSSQYNCQPHQDTFIFPVDVYQQMKGWDSVGDGYFTISEDSYDVEFYIPLSTLTDQPDQLLDISMRITRLGDQWIYCYGTSTSPYIAVAIGFGIVAASFGYVAYRKRRLSHTK